jgi:hypothetical protein
MLSKVVATLPTPGLDFGFIDNLSAGTNDSLGFQPVSIRTIERLFPSSYGLPACRPSGR